MLLANAGTRVDDAHCVKQIGAAARAHPRKKPPADFTGTFIGEDAYFVVPSPAKPPHEWVVFGVADGVSAAGKMLWGRLVCRVDGE